MIISVASGKGGTGKTTVAVCLALSVPESLYIDCDVEEPNGHLLLDPVIASREAVVRKMPQVNEDRCTHCGVCADACEFHAIVVLPASVMILNDLCHGCGVCSYVCPTGAITEFDAHHGVIRRGRAGADGPEFIDGTLDVGEMSASHLIGRVRLEAPPDRVTFLDAPPGTSCSMVAAVRGTDFCLLVTESTPFGLHDLTLAVHVLRVLGVPFGVVINKYDGTYSAPEEFCAAGGIPVIMRIPFDRAIAEAYSRGIPPVTALPEWKERFKDMYETIRSLAGSASLVSKVDR